MEIFYVCRQLVFTIDNFHAAAAQYVGGPYQYGIRNFIGNSLGIIKGYGRTTFWCRKVGLLKHLRSEERRVGKGGKSRWGAGRGDGQLDAHSSADTCRSRL